MSAALSSFDSLDVDDYEQTTYALYLAYSSYALGYSEAAWKEGQAIYARFLESYPRHVAHAIIVNELIPRAVMRIGEQMYHEGKNEQHHPAIINRVLMCLLFDVAPPPPVAQIQVPCEPESPDPEEGRDPLSDAFAEDL